MAGGELNDMLSLYTAFINIRGIPTEELQIHHHNSLSFLHITSTSTKCDVIKSDIEVYY
jgi:hypothetical protein